MEGFKKKDSTTFPAHFSHNQVDFMGGNFGELFVPLSTMGGGKESPLSLLYVCMDYRNQKNAKFRADPKNPSSLLELFGAQ